MKSAKYQFNIRSFHPEKDFGWSGMFFEGDNRGFSNRPSGLGEVTSRIWHRFTIGLNTGDKVANITESDRSRAPWSKREMTYDGVLKPKGTIEPIVKTKIGESIKGFRIKGHYGGVNHAMPGSPAMQKKLGFSYVPTLDVYYEIKMDFDLSNKTLDIVTYIKGDGFPNCESFIVDEHGNSVFLGIHVRKGAAPISLSLNLDYPMIVSAIRLPISDNGSFSGMVGDELNRKSSGAKEISFQTIKLWNSRFLTADPNARRCMLLEKSSLEGCFE